MTLQACEFIFSTSHLVYCYKKKIMWREFGGKIAGVSLVPGGQSRRGSNSSLRIFPFVFEAAQKRDIAMFLVTSPIVITRYVTYCH